MARLAGLLLIAFATVASGCASTPSSQQTPPPTSTGPLPAAACDAPAKMPDLGAEHIDSLTYAYPQHPATSGPHYPVWIKPPPQVFATNLPETRAVHNLEHGYVVVYYSLGPDAPLPADILTVLTASITGERKVLMAPYRPLPEGKALAFAAWDELQLCGPTVTAAEARSALDKFIAAFREGPLAPEAKSP